MAKPVLSAPHFRNEEAAFAYVEAHLWPDGPVCPHCGNIDQASFRRGRPAIWCFISVVHCHASRSAA